eukprot:PhM_4_TR191/c0_g1_i1/m.3670
MSDVDTLLKKSVLADPEFLKKRVAPNPYDDFQAKKKEKESRTNRLDQWYGMKRVDAKDVETKKDLQMLHYREFVRNERIYKRPSKEPLPEFAEIGTVVVDKLNDRENIGKRRRASTMADEWMKDPVVKEFTPAVPAHLEPKESASSKRKSKKRKMKK